MQNEFEGSDLKGYVEELRKNNELLARMVHNQSNWKLALRQGLVTGLGGFLGATVLISLLLWIIQPLKQLEVLKPTLDRIADQLEHKPTR